MACCSPSNGMCPADGMPARSRKDAGRIARVRMMPGWRVSSRRHCPVTSCPGGRVQLSILLLAADRGSVQPLAAALTEEGHGVTVVTKPEDAAAAAASYSLVMIDRVAPPVTVADVVAMLRSASPPVEAPVLAVAATGSLDERIALLEAGADDVIAPPFAEPQVPGPIQAPSLQSQRPPIRPRGPGIGRGQRP